MKRFSILVIAFLMIAQCSFAQLSIHGRVVYDYDSEPPLSFVTVHLLKNGIIADVALTDSAGYYFFDGVGPGEHTIRFSYDKPWVGCDLDDANRVIQFINEQITFTELQYDAADVDGDGFITSYDVSLIIAKYLDTTTAFPAGEWLFKDVVLNMDTLFGQTTAEAGKSKGRKNGSTKIETCSTKEYQTTYSVAKAMCADVSASILEFPVRSLSTIQFKNAGLNVYFNSKKLRVLEIIPVHPDLLYKKDADEIKLALISPDGRQISMVEGDTLFIIRFQILQHSTVNQPPFILLPSSKVRMSGENSFQQLGIELPGRIEVRKEVDDITVYPNPAAEFIMLKSQSKAPSQMSVTLVNPTGKTVLVQKVQMHGESESRIDFAGIAAGEYLLVVDRVIDGLSTRFTKTLIIKP